MYQVSKLTHTHTHNSRSERESDGATPAHTCTYAHIHTQEAAETGRSNWGNPGAAVVSDSTDLLSRALKMSLVWSHDDLPSKCTMFQTHPGFLGPETWTTVSFHGKVVLSQANIQQSWMRPSEPLETPETEKQSRNQQEHGGKKSSIHKSCGSFPRETPPSSNV